MKKFLVLLLALVVVLAMTGVALGSTVSIKVGAKGNSFSPKTKSVSKGTKAQWCNSSTTTHTVTAYKGHWSKNTTLGGTSGGTTGGTTGGTGGGGGGGGGYGPIKRAGSCTGFTFKKPGTYKYRCTIHSTLTNGACSGMCGTIKVS